MSNEYPSANIDFRAVPVVNVENVEASVAYYCDKLGFEMSWDFS
jgi:catechol 2,3-dioxygenase-like lactoylglutathione lyase family enzyme